MYMTHDCLCNSHRVITACKFKHLVTHFESFAENNEKYQRYTRNVDLAAMRLRSNEIYDIISSSPNYYDGFSKSRSSHS